MDIDIQKISVSDLQNFIAKLPADYRLEVILPDGYASTAELMSVTVDDVKKTVYCMFC